MRKVFVLLLISTLLTGCRWSMKDIEHVEVVSDPVEQVPIISSYEKDPYTTVDLSLSIGDPAVDGMPAYPDEVEDEPALFSASIGAFIREPDPERTTIYGDYLDGGYIVNGKYKVGDRVEYIEVRVDLIDEKIEGLLVVPKSKDPEEREKQVRFANNIHDFIDSTHIDAVASIQQVGDDTEILEGFKNAINIIKKKAFNAYE